VREQPRVTDGYFLRGEFSLLALLQVINETFNNA
jgi:hypothetical protein